MTRAAGRPPRVALVLPFVEGGGGVPGVAKFLHRVLEDSGRYRPELISIALSSRDAESVRLLAPSTWSRGVSVREGRWQDLSFRHVGAFLTELEFQRYRPRAALTRILNTYEIVQVVAGIPSWAMVARDVRCPVALQVATLVTVERHEVLARTRGAAGLWRRAMTALLARMDRAALSHVGAAFVENAWMYERLRSWMDPSRVHFAPPGIDTDRFRPADAGPPADRYILCVGRLADPRKRVRLLLEAYGLLREAVPEAPRLVLAGDGGLASADREYARSLGLGDRLEVRADVPLQELVELYRQAYLYALSSDEEGLGLVILEAMASGLPVVSTDCGGPSTSVIDGDTGFLVPCGDAPAMARRMRELVEDPALAREMGRRGRERAVATFSLESTGRRFLDWYDAALAGRP